MHKFDDKRNPNTLKVKGWHKIGGPDCLLKTQFRAMMKNHSILDEICPMPLI